MTPQPPNGHGGTCAICSEPTVIRATQGEVAFALCIKHAQEWLKIPAGSVDFKKWVSSFLGQPSENMKVQVTMTEDRKTILLMFPAPVSFIALEVSQAQGLVKAIQYYLTQVKA